MRGKEKGACVLTESDTVVQDLYGSLGSLLYVRELRDGDARGENRCQPDRH